MVVVPLSGAVRPSSIRFSHTWLDRGGAEGDLMELNGWTSPQMLRLYRASARRASARRASARRASARRARARRAYDRIMEDRS